MYDPENLELEGNNQEEKEFDLEKKKFQFELHKFKKENNFWKQNMATILSTTVTIIALGLTYVQYTDNKEFNLLEQKSNKVESQNKMMLDLVTNFNQVFGADEQQKNKLIDHFIEKYKDNDLTIVFEIMKDNSLYLEGLERWADKRSSQEVNNSILFLDSRCENYILGKNNMYNSIKNKNEKRCIPITNADIIFYKIKNRFSSLRFVRDSINATWDNFHLIKKLKPKKIFVHYSSFKMYYKKYGEKLEEKLIKPLNDSLDNTELIIYSRQETIKETCNTLNERYNNISIKHVYIKNRPSDFYNENNLKLIVDKIRN